MRKLKLQVQITADGYVAGPNGEEDWVVKLDEACWNLINEIADGSSTLLLGRKMAEGFVPHFEAFKPDHARFAFAQKMVNISKVIFTKTLDQPFGKNACLASGALADEIGKLKRQEGKDILVYGGAGFVSSLIAGGHIDEIFFFVNPVLIGNGVRIGGQLAERRQLSLMSGSTFACGVTVLHYQLNNG